MKNIRYVLRDGVTVSLVLLLVGVVPAPVFADDGQNAADYGPAAAAEAHEAPATSSDGPTGAASWTFTFNHGTGLWENDYYSYNPSTKETVPKNQPEYTYNHATGMWDTRVWEYSAAQGAYIQIPVSVTTPPAGAVTHGGSAKLADSDASFASGHKPGHEAPNSHHGEHTATPPPSGHGSEYPGGHGQAGSQKTLDTSTNASLNNNLDSQAQSGDAAATANTTAGNTASGDATAMTNVMNLLQSQSAMAGTGLKTFTADIQGNVQGDFLIDPTTMAQPANLTPQELEQLQVNKKTEGSINNAINLDAGSGAATAEQNTTVGDVVSGDANAIANVVNMINSVVAANQSFMGTVNIHGDYTGNILMPTDSLNALLGSAAGDGAVAGQTTVETASNQQIANDIDLSAVSGAVTATENTTAGSVTSGNGLTNLTLLNLTGRQVVADNSLLVFVNVLGNWVGLIMDAPAGTTAAAIGGGVAQDAPAATAEQAKVTNKEDFGITNAIKATAKSGDAAAKQNTTVGDVRSGDATASANVANIVDSQFNLTNWFGVLFINVFGTWRGNFGVAKEPVVAPITSGLSGPASGALGSMQEAQVFAFTPKAEESGSGAGSTTDKTDLTLSPLSEAQASGAMTSDEMVERVSRVLSATAGKDLNKAAAAPRANPVADIDWSPLAIALGLAGFGLVGADRFRTYQRTKKLVVRR
ncbi:MAG TPA: hypothetical protein VK978_02365 [Candidatus Saccharimonadales bacterium]|nr:hypothetical protein [Candidatus Saccharimonadales bacterium]